MRLKSNLKIISGPHALLPLVDLFFLLLIFFLLGSSMIMWQGTKVNLPPGSAEIYSANKIIISISKEGDKYFLNDSPINKADLEVKLAELVQLSRNDSKENGNKIADSQNIVAVLRADLSISSAEVMHVLKIARKCKVTIVWATEEKMKSGESFRHD